MNNLHVPLHDAIYYISRLYDMQLQTRILFCFPDIGLCKPCYGPRGSLDDAIYQNIRALGFLVLEEKIFKLFVSKIHVLALHAHVT